MVKPLIRKTISSCSRFWLFVVFALLASMSALQAQTVIPTTSAAVVFSTESNVTHDPNWSDSNNFRHSNLARTGGNLLGASVAVSFAGTGITWVGQKGPNFGIAYVSVDGGPVQHVDNFSSTNIYPDNVYTANGLRSGFMYAKAGSGGMD
jgi:hypothetical protein